MSHIYCFYLIPCNNGVFGKSSYHAQNLPYLLQTTVLARNGIYHTGTGLYGTCHYMQGLYFMACTVPNLYSSFLSPKTPLGAKFRMSLMSKQTSLLEDSDDAIRWTMLPQYFVKPLRTLWESGEIESYRISLRESPPDMKISRLQEVLMSSMRPITPLGPWLILNGSIHQRVKRRQAKRTECL